jgi:hypothetical protein
MKLDFNNLENQTSQRNFEKLQREFDSNPILTGQWKLMTVPAGTSGTIKLYHKLGFIPSDIVFTKQVGTFVFDYTKFNEETITVTCTSAEGRFLVGRMKA